MLIRCRFLAVQLFLCCSTVLLSIEIEAPLPDGQDAGNLTGEVVDRENQFIPGAVVIIRETGQNVIAAGDGTFIFKNLKPGTYTLECVTDAFKTVITEPVEVKGGETSHVTIRALHIKPLSEEMVVTATLTGRRLKDVPVRTELVTREALDDKSALNLADAVDGVTGLRVENNCQNCGFSQLRINGLEGRYSLILIDGIPVMTSLANVYGLEQIPTEIMERIEIVKGVGSAIYGGSAVGGVVNIITRTPTFNSGNLDFNIGSIDGSAANNFSGSGNVMGNEGRTALMFFGAFSNADPYDRDGDGFSELGLRKNRSFGFKLHQHFLEDAGELTLRLNKMMEFRRGGNAFDLPPHLTDVTEQIDTDRTGSNLEWKHTVSGDTFYRVSLTYADTDRKTYYGAGMDPNAYGKTDNPFWIYDSHASHRIAGSHTLLGGVQFTHDHIIDTHPAYNNIIDETYTDLGLFVQDEFEVTKSLIFLGGLRADKHSAINHTIFSPRAAIIYKPGEKWRFRGALSFGFKPPQLFDEDLHIEISGGEPVIHINSPDLVEEKAKSVNFAVEYNSFLGFTFFRLEANAFYTRLDDVMVLEEIDDPAYPDTRVVLRTNGEGAEVYGIEFNGDLDINTFFGLQSGLTLQRSKLDEPEPEFGSTSFFRTPEVYGFFSFKVLPGPATKIVTTYLYTGRMEVPHFSGYIEENRLETTDPFHVINIRFSQGLGFISNLLEASEFYIAGFNLLDSFQDDFDRGPDRDAGYIYGPRRPRSVASGIKFTF